MAVVIRLRRMGHKKAPYFRLVVTDKRFKRDGRFIEVVGTYHPIPSGEKISESIKKDRIEHWLSCGAQPSDTVWSILKRAGIQKPAPKAKPKKEEKTEAKPKKKAETAAKKSPKKKTTKAKA